MPRGLAALLALCLALAACGLPRTGPPEDNEYPLNNHGQP